MATGERAKRVIGSIYSAAARRVYEPVVVKGTFRFLGGDLNDLVIEQGRSAVMTAKGGPILDLPVGTAYFTVEAARAHDGLVVGADIARGMVEKAAATARDAGLDNLSTVQADAHHLPFADGSFAAVLCTNGLQVMPGLLASLKELRRVLADDGTLFVSVVTLPLGAALPSERALQLPTMLQSSRELVGAMGRAGLEARITRRSRLAFLLEAKRL